MACISRSTLVEYLAALSEVTQDVRVDLCFDRGDLVEIDLGELRRGDLAVDQQPLGLARRQAQRIERRHRQLILGTRNESSPTAGAFRRASSRELPERGLSARMTLTTSRTCAVGDTEAVSSSLILSMWPRILTSSLGHAVHLVLLEAQAGELGDVADIVFADHVWGRLLLRTAKKPDGYPTPASKTGTRKGGAGRPAPRPPLQAIPACVRRAVSPWRPGAPCRPR